MPNTNEVTLRYSISNHPEDPLNETGYRFTLEVLSTGRQDIPKELFLCQKRPVAAHSEYAFPYPYDDQQDSFISVCTLEDLASYPVGQPDTNSRSPQYFRKAKLEGVMKDQSIVIYTIETVKYLIEKLLQSVKMNEEEEVIEVVAVISAE